jgi:hypothetical protein
MVTQRASACGSDEDRIGGEREVSLSETRIVVTQSSVGRLPIRAYGRGSMVRACCRDGKPFGLHGQASVAILGSMGQRQSA